MFLAYSLRVLAAGLPVCIRSLSRSFNRLQQKPKRSEVQAMAADEPKAPNNGKWSLDDPDIKGEGPFGPLVDVEAHGKDWGKVAARLKEMETGEAPKALDHPEIGDIDVIWGDYDPKTKKGFGLKKVAEKHPEVIQDLPEIVRSSKIHSRSDNRVILIGDTHKSLIAMNYKGEDKVWLLTSFEYGKSQRAAGSIERSGSHQADAHSSSASLTKDSVRPETEKINESRRAEGRTERSDSQQMDTHSSFTSSADPEMRLPDGKGKVAPAEKVELETAIAKLDEETDAALEQARMNHMSGELTCSEDGIARSAVKEAHQKQGKRLVDITNKLVKLTRVAAVRKGIKKPLGQKKSGVLGTHNTLTADYLGNLSEEEKVYLISRNLSGKAAKAKKLHPLDRAKRAVRAISALRKDLADSTITGADGPLPDIKRIDRGAIVDILETIAMKEARNALVLINQPGWQHRGLMDIEGHYRELEAVNPAVLKVLADRYASGNVVPWKTVQEVWPDYRKRLLEDGTNAPLHDLIAISGQGTELSGQKIKRKAKPEIPGKAG